MTTDRRRCWRCLHIAYMHNLCLMFAVKCLMLIADAGIGLALPLASRLSALALPWAFPRTSKEPCRRVAVRRDKAALYPVAPRFMFIPSYTAGRRQGSFSALLHVVIPVPPFVGLLRPVTLLQKGRLDSTSEVPYRMRCEGSRCPSAQMQHQQDYTRVYLSHIHKCERV